MKYNETELETLEQLDQMYMAAIRTYLKYRTRFSKGQVSGMELSYIALNLSPAEFIQMDVDEIFREE